MKKLIIPIALLVMNLSSCTKEEKIKGCTDINSINYNPKAQESDGSCSFAGSIVFYSTKEVAENLVSQGYTSLEYYIDDKLIGTSSASMYFKSVPDCNTQSATNTTVSLGSSKSKNFFYSIKSNGEQLFKGTIQVEANSCNPIEL